MKTAYLLPCPCGREIPVQVAQAGQQITCECGQSLEVPTMRALRGLKSAEPRSPATRRASSWGGRQAVLLLGAFITLAALGAVAAASYHFRDRVTVPEVDQLSPFRTWLLWQYDLRPGIDRPFSWQQPIAYQRKLYNRWLIVSGVVAGIGVITMVCSLFIPKRTPRRRRKPPRGA